MIGPLTVTRGLAASFVLQVVDAQGRPRVGLRETDVLSAEVWAGDDQAPLFRPSCQWLDAEVAATYRLAVAGAQTAGLKPGGYQLLVTIARDQETRSAGRAAFQVLGAPGLGSPRRTFGTFDAMARRSDVFRQLAGADDDQAGFAEQRADAADWVEDVIIARSESGDGLRDGLRSGRLRVRPGSTLADVATAFACHRVLEGQVGDDRYAAMSARFLAEARARARSLVAELEDDRGRLVARVDCGLIPPSPVRTRRTP